MDIYTKKRRWKIFLFTTAVVIVTLSLWYTNILVNGVARDERKNVKIWADAIQRRAKLVNYTENFFQEIKAVEQNRAELLAETYRRIAIDSKSADLTFYLNIISKNTTIPVILATEEGEILFSKNISFDQDEVTMLSEEMIKEFSVYSPIIVNFSYNMKHFLYYKESRIFTELRQVLNDLIESFFSEVVVNSASVPVIITDSTKTNVIITGNIENNNLSDSSYLQKTIKQMAYENAPIEIDLSGQGMTYIFYKDSYLLTQLRFYPYVQFGIIGLFLFIAYLLFSTARKSEQNQVWVGMSKETAHQLGTPLSSIMAWLELLRLKDVDEEAITEMEKDVNRLKTITERFSKIGSGTNLNEEDIVKIIYDSVEYIKSRTSKNIKYHINIAKNRAIIIPVNLHLFEWVIENICKNAVDAMSGKGELNIDISEDGSSITIDFSDTGKGIPKANFKAVFHPGYTSKQRGWGLGLSLAKRIINDYHSGKIFVKSSTIDKGTTFRIVLKKSES